MDELNKKKCQKCNGKGHYSGRLMNCGTSEMEWHEVISCDVPGCHNGTMNLEENSKAFYAY
jgi:hypothetical protein